MVISKEIAGLINYEVKLEDCYAILRKTKGVDVKTSTPCLYLNAKQLPN